MISTMEFGSLEVPAEKGDHVLRAITDDDNFRVITADTTETVRQALAAQSAEGATARHFADLLTGTVLIRETMSPGHRVQGVLKGTGGRGSLVADAHPDGITRGLVQLPKGTEDFEIGEGSVLQMMRSTARGIHRSMVQPRPGATVPEALMTYMQVSEQIVSVIETGAHWEEGAITHAGGFVVQLLPGASRGPLQAMIERLEAGKKATLDRTELMEERNQIYEREKQLRENLAALQDKGDEGKLRNRVLSQLEGCEDRLAEIEDKLIALAELIANSEKEVEEIINALSDEQT